MSICSMLFLIMTRQVGYWSLINDTEENGAISWAIDAASKILDEYPDQQDYAEILTNLIMMQSGDIAEQVQNQSQYDDLKTEQIMLMIL